MKASKFAHVHMGRRPVVSIYGDVRHYAAMAAEMDGSTAKRRVVRRLAPIAAFILAASPASRSVVNADCRSVAAPMLAVAKTNGIELSGWMIMWPAGDRQHRRYVLGFGEAATPKLFTKVSLRPTEDARFFLREAAMLRWLSSSPIRGWRTPRLYQVDATEKSISITTEALPPGRRNMTWPEIWDLLPLELEHSSTTPIARDSSEAAAIADGPGTSGSTVIPDGRVGIDISAESIVNGDVTPSNALQVGIDHWLVDWELASASGPSGCDIVAAVINVLARRRLRSTEALAEATVVECAAAGVSQRSFARSIAYLSSVGNPTAARLADFSRLVPMYKEGS